MRKYWLLLVLIILTSLLALDPLFHKGIFTAHDVEANIGRFGAFFLSIKEGHLIPSWAGYVANGYGSPILMFSYALPYYLQLPIAFLGFSLVDTTKIYILISFIASAILMYLFLRKHVSEWPAFMGSLLYVYAPYRINDIYARGSISEHTAFIAVPLVGLALARIFKKQDFLSILFLAMGFFLLLYSHPLFVIVVAPFFILYLFINLHEKHQNNKWMILLNIGKAVLITISMSAYFWIPFFLENKYLHYNINPFSHAWSTQFVSIAKLIVPEWTFIDSRGRLEYQTWQIGIVHIVIVLVSTCLAFRFKRKNKELFWLGLGSFVVSLFFMLPISYFVYLVIPFLQHIQFPWRFMGLTVIGVSLLGAYLFETLTAILKKSHLVVLCGAVVVALLLCNLPYARGHGNSEIADDYYLYELVSNTEGIATSPIWSTAPEQYQRAPNRPDIISGIARIDLKKRTSTTHSYIVTAETDTIISENTFYFPNWQVFVSGEVVPIEFQNPNHRGIITYSLPVGRHEVEVVFSDTKLRLAAKLISGFTVLMLIFGYVFQAYFFRKKHL